MMHPETKRFWWVATAGTLFAFFFLSDPLPAVGLSFIFWGSLWFIRRKDRQAWETWDAKVNYNHVGKQQYAETELKAAYKKLRDDIKNVRLLEEKWNHRNISTDV